MHFLSLQMEPILHNGCPHNCEDLLSWLPVDIATRVLSYLDPGTYTCTCMLPCGVWYLLCVRSLSVIGLQSLSYPTYMYMYICKVNISVNFTLVSQFEELSIKLLRKSCKKYCAKIRAEHASVSNVLSLHVCMCIHASGVL